MDISANHPDPLYEALQGGLARAVQVGSFAMTGAQVYAYHRRAQTQLVAERDQHAQRALHAQIRTEKDAARAGWAPALDPVWLRQATLIDTARAWGNSMPYADRAVPWYEPTAATAMRTSEDRLRHLHPFAMARYDRLRGEGLPPAEAMREAAPLFAYHPHAHDAPSVPRPALDPAPTADHSADTAGTTRAASNGNDRSATMALPCDEDFPMTIHEVLAAETGSDTPAMTRPARAAQPSARSTRP